MRPHAAGNAQETIRGPVRLARQALPNTRPEMTPATDRGPVADDVVLEIYVEVIR